MDTLAEKLTKAVVDVDVTEVRRLLEAGADATGLDVNENVPIVLTAADTGNVELVAALLDAGAGLEASDDGGATPLVAAVHLNSEDLVRFLIARGADIEAHYDDPDSEGTTPLNLACEEDTPLSILEALLGAGADPNRRRNDGWTPLMLAAHAGRRDALEALLEAGADPRASKGRGADRVTAASIARHWKHDEIAELLEAAGRRLPEAILELIDAEYRRLGATSMFEEWCQLEPSTQDDINALEALVGVDMPAEYRDFLLVNRRRHSFDFNFECLDVKGVMNSWQVMADLVGHGTFDDGRLEARASAGNWDSGKIKRVWWSKKWIPVSEDSCGNMVCLDLDPDDKGTMGQLMQMEVQDGQGPFPSAFTSFTDYLEHHLECLQSGKCRVEDGVLEVDSYS